MKWITLILMLALAAGPGLCPAYAEDASPARSGANDAGSAQEGTSSDEDVSASTAPAGVFTSTAPASDVILSTAPAGTETGPVEDFNGSDEDLTY